MLIFFRMILNLAFYAQVYYVFYASMMAGISSSVVIVIYSCNILTTAFAFKLIYNENINLVHYIGIFFMMACVAFITNGKDHTIAKTIALEE